MSERSGNRLQPSVEKGRNCPCDCPCDAHPEGKAVKSMSAARSAPARERLRISVCWKQPGSTGSPWPCPALRGTLHERPNALDVELPQKGRVPEPDGVETEVEHLVDRIVRRPVLDHYPVSGDAVSGPVSALCAVNVHRPAVGVLQRSLQRFQEQHDLRLVGMPGVHGNAQIPELRPLQQGKIIVLIPQTQDGLRPGFFQVAKSGLRRLRPAPQPGRYLREILDTRNTGVAGLWPAACGRCCRARGAARDQERAAKE